MDIFSLLSYVNKVSLLAFFVTTLIVAYQIYILKKEKTKEQAPSIPDFKEMNRSNEAVNYTRLPDFLIKKNNKSISYSKLVFLIISLLTIMVVIFVFIVIKQNGSSRNQVLVNPPAVISQTPIRKSVSPTLKVILSPSPVPPPTDTPMTPSPTVSSSPMLTPSPTEIVLAQTPSLTPANGSNNTSPTQAVTNNQIQTLPETGSIEKALLIIGVAILAIFFSFWF